ncbi:MAG TPA: ABC transporter substrate-binding protein [Thermodesulfobacteriota bacterium]|jgi:ABC-type nitrate/sulfonate/bicarbonate transport system substrate-binding protein|nr:ABC transporter substrate-binding protein [Thermodesulfobacteriota bacterium]
MKKQVAVLLIILLLLMAGTALSEDKVKIGYMRIAHSLPTFVAVEKGLFDQEGVKVELTPFETSTIIIGALMAGRIDANCCSGTPGYWFAEQSAPGQFRIFLTYGSTSIKNPTLVAIVKKDSPLKELKELKGKRVGASPPGASLLETARAVIRSQMDPEGVTFQEIPPTILISTLAAGQIDAFFALEPSGMIAISQGIGRHLIVEPSRLLGLERGFAGTAFGFSAQFLKQNPLLAKKLKSVYYKAVDMIDKDRNTYRPLLMKYLGFPESIAMNVPLTNWMKIEALDKEATQQYFDILYREGAFKKKIDTTKLYYED